MKKLTYKQYCKLYDAQYKKGFVLSPEILKVLNENNEFRSRKGREIKAKFDKLTYDGKLEFFEKRHELPHVVNTEQLIPDEPGKERDGIDLEKSISIHPTLPDECVKYIDWRVKREFTKRVENFHSTINKKKRQTEKEDYTKSQLEMIVEQKNRMVNTKQNFAETIEYFNRGYAMKLNEINFNDAHNYFYEFTPSNLILGSLIDGMVAYEYEHFLKEELYKFETDNITNTDPKIIIHWNGNKNQLYDVFRQLKTEGRISNSYTDLAVFLKFNFDNFNATSLSTLETELQRGKRPPKARRIQLASGNLE